MNVKIRYTNGATGETVEVHGFKLDDDKQRCARCGRGFPKVELGVLTIKNEKTGEKDKYPICYKCGLKLIENK